MSVVSIPDAVAISIAGQCDCGKVREENQDRALHVSTSLGDLLIVADGIGGYPGGGVASQMAVDTVSSCVRGMPTFFPPEIAVEEAICHANAAIAAAAAEPDSPNNHMGTTMIAALLRTDPDRAHAPVQAIIAHVGDSRAYLVHNQKLAQLTRDHSVVQDLLDSDRITPQEAENHPDASMLTRCLGHEPSVQVEMREVPLEVGDTLLLCSDGLWGYVSDREIERVLADRALDVESAARTLLDLALAAGGHDNIGIQLARIRVPDVHAAARASSPAPHIADPTRQENPVAKPVLRKPASGVAAKKNAVSPTVESISQATPTPSARRPAPGVASTWKPVLPPAETILTIVPAPPPAPLPAAPAYKSAPPPAPAPVPVIELAAATQINPARYADSMMLPELIVVPRIESISAPRSSIASTPEPAQIGFARLAAIFLLAFAASGTLAYLALVYDWLGILHLAR